jgi:hypothetical protein
VVGNNSVTAARRKPTAALNDLFKDANNARWKAAMEDGESKWRVIAEHLFGECASSTVAPSTLPSLDAESSSKVLHCLSTSICDMHHQHSDALAVAKAVK